ncbi:SMC family ATPase [Robbsia andropogonis]|uniref:SMC family ATPase n=1 Tax=Robbsia andropogonis TaxID=28092 RepID=UPI0020A04AE1|nr:SMC family ATPase [Robbsia andropogonis]MCP1121515.1 SMC family ATPase [Robbsia andropogonis]MCP1131335.1 SMC family ATPase [Robbsia andropogonis]
MQPLKLVLDGFVGIRNGLKRDRLELDLEDLPCGLIALTGPNGSGKTTIMDNLHPYRVMPSRTSKLSVDSFSYWDHLCAPQALKELDWIHAGKRYRSTFVFRKPGKTGKAEYFLTEMNSSGVWIPYRAPDGTESDGKADTYDRCVEAVCGTMASFFTSVFSAQNRRPLSAYGASEIKGLLADLLKIDDLLKHSAKANEVAKALGVELDVTQATLRDLGSAQASRVALAETLAHLGELGKSLKAQRSQTSQTLDGLQLEYAKAVARHKDSATATARRNELSARCNEIALATEAFDKAAKNTQSSLDSRQVALRESVRRHEAILLQRDSVLAAARIVEREREVTAKAEAELVRLQRELAEFDVKRLRHTELTGLMADVQNQGLSKLQLLETFKHQASVIEAVPCRSMAIRDGCPLLKQAHAAAVEVQVQQVSVDALRAKFAKYRDESAPLSTATQQFLDKQKELQTVTITLEKSRQRWLQASELHAKRSLLVEAERCLKDASAELGVISRARQAATQQADAERVRLAKEKADVERELAILAADDASAEIAKLDSVIREAREAAAVLDARIESTVRDHLLRQEEDRMLTRKLEGLCSAQALADRLSNEIAHWKLLAKGLGANGIVALTIDDAGPSLAKLANDLLLECYGSRFTVEIRTQREIASGELREGFEILVHDADSGESIPVTMMSGGEKVWINECLIRSIAIYLAQNAGQPYRTSFVDESDGPLDVERKRQFVRMKRAVLKRGGYEREFYISHTPDLICEADAVINVASLAL